MILVTGGSGFIGLNLLRRLAAAPSPPPLRALLRNPDAARGLDGLPVERFKGDILDPASLRAAMQGATHVYHVAGRVDLGPFSANALRAVNVTGTENVCRAAREAGVRRLVHTSTVSTIGVGSPEAPADETTVFDSSRIQVPYFMTKREGELAALAAGADGRLEVVVVNPSLVLGAWDLGPSSGEIILVSAKVGGVPFYAQGALNAVHVDDVVDGHLAAMARGRPGERYILGNENFTHKALLELVADELGLRKPVIPIIDWAALPFTVWGDLLGPFFPQAFKSWNSRMLKVMRVAQYVRCDKARQELGLGARPVRTAIREAFDWYVEHGRLRARPRPSAS